MFDGSFLSQALVWVICGIYFAAIFPQIFLNHKLKSTAGLSNLMLIFFLIGYVAEGYYVLCLKLPIGYRVFVPLGSLAVIFMFIQKFYFGGITSDKLTLFGFLGVILGSIFLIPYALGHYLTIGNIAGWVGAFIWSTYKIPQVFKMYKSKSVAGVSALFFVTLWFGAFLEAVVAITLHLPKQTLFNGIYGIIVNTTLLVMFYIYRKSRGV